MFAKLNPLEASQLIDQVMAPRIVGQVLGGLNVPQFVPIAKQSSAETTTDGATTPPPAALADAGAPSPIWSGRKLLCN